ncbi:MAG: response regulator [Candidatus Xenobia bacterium]
MSQPTVLCIEDEPQIQRFLRTPLKAHGYHMVEALTGEQGLAMAASEHPDVIILDLGLPDMEGLDLARELRQRSETPIIVLSARGQEIDKVQALDAGADDYLTKPFSIGELLARMRVALRHAAQTQQEPERVIQLGPLKVDLLRRQVTLDGNDVHLTPIEYQLLLTLCRHPGKVLTHRQLLKEVWGPEYVEDTHYLRVYMGQLRHKLELTPARPCYLLTEPGVGYRFAAD